MPSSPSLPFEPSAATLAHHPARWLLATRPAFLSLTLGGVLLGALSSPVQALATHWPRLALGLLLALLLHAAVNVLNDVADHDNGCDAANLSRLFPFTGGSRFIQNGVLSAREMQWLGRGLLLAVAAGGLSLVWLCGSRVLAVGVAGLLLGWGYSAPALRLGSRGLGELCVLCCFWLLPVGSALVLDGAFPSRALWAGLPYALLSTALLLINQFPDRAADAAAGKCHWVVRLGGRRAAPVYGVLVVLAALALWAAVATAALPPAALLLASPALALSLYAATALLRFHAAPARLRPAIVCSVLAANLLPWLLAAAVLSA